MKITIKEFFDPQTWTITYVVADQQTRDAVIIDPVWDYDPASSKISSHSLEAVERYIKANEFKIHYILETHAHADHLSGSQPLKEKFPQAQIGIGAHIAAVQKVFKDVFNLDPQFATDGSQFDVLLTEETPLLAGSIEIKTIFTPGHTPACASYLIGENVFTGDALFMPDYGTGRCDFPAGSADDLYTSIHEKLYKLPEHTQVYTGHDYMPAGRELQFQSTIGEQKLNNIQLKEKTTRQEFVKMRTERDATLKAPRLLLPSVQVNIDAGRLPAAENNGVSYLKMPLRL